MTNGKITIDIEDYNKLCELIYSSLKFVPTIYRDGKTAFFNRIVDKYENATNVMMVCMTQKDFDKLFDIKKEVIDIMAGMVCKEVSENE